MLYKRRYRAEADEEAEPGNLEELEMKFVAREVFRSAVFLSPTSSSSNLRATNVIP